MTLSDIGFRWTVVANRVKTSHDLDGWNWLLSPEDEAVVREDTKSYAIAHTRGWFGSLHLVAKRLTPA